MADTSDIRTPAQIEADIKRRREVLAETLDEIGVRVRPKTIVGDAKAKVVSNIDHTLGRAYVSVNKAVTEVKAVSNRVGIGGVSGMAVLVSGISYWISTPSCRPSGVSRLPPNGQSVD